jgi:hypothetical protein
MAYNYHGEIISIIDLILLCASVFLGILIFAYIVIKERADDTRNRKLTEIKENLYRLFLSGKPVSARDKTASNATVQQFVDVETNRRRDAVFFNQYEQDIFKKCFLTADTIKTLEETAKKSRNKWRRIEAIIALGLWGDESVVTILQEALKSKDPDISYFAILAVSQTKKMFPAIALLNLLKRDPNSRRKVVAALEYFPQEISDEIIKLTRDPDPAVRYWSLRLLVKFKPVKYRIDIEKLTKDESPDVRAAACDCLGDIGNNESAETIKRCLRDDVWFVRMHAVRALSKLIGEESVAAIIDLLNDGSLYVLDSVKNVMTVYIRAALPYVKTLLEGTDALAKKICLEAMENSGYFGELIKKVSAEGEGKPSEERKLFENTVRAGAHFGIEAALEKIDSASRDRVLRLIKKIDAPLAEHFEKKLSNQLNEL